MRENVTFKQTAFLKITFFMVIMLGMCFLSSFTSYAEDYASIPIEMHMSKTGEQDFPSEWDFLLKFRNEDGSEIINEHELNSLPDDRITWKSSQGNSISRVLEMRANRVYAISIFNKDPDNPFANYDQSGWEYDSAKYFLEVTDEDDGPKYKIWDENKNAVSKMVFYHTYNRSKIYTSGFAVKLDIRQSNTAVPPSQVFQFEFDNLDSLNQPNLNALEIVNNSITAKGVGTVDKVLKVNINVDDILAADSKWDRPASLPWLYTAVFKLKVKNDGAAHWKYDNNFRYILFTYNDKSRMFDARVLQALGNDAYASFAEFTNTYTASSGEDATPTVPDKDGMPIVPDKDGMPIVPDKDGMPIVPDKSGTPTVPGESGTPTKGNISIAEFTEKHIAYIKGYPDATVRPTGNITRAETATMIYRLLTDARRLEIKSDKNNFSDVSSNVWYHESASSMAKGRYIVGYPDGTFRGDETITRAEFVTMLVRFIEPLKGEKVFSDVKESHWAYNQIGTASAAGWISGYENGKFEPDKSITRAEVASILNRVLHRGVNQKSTLLNFKNWQDNPAGSWYYYEIIEAGNTHEHKGTRPSEHWTKILD